MSNLNFSFHPYCQKFGEFFGVIFTDYKSHWSFGRLRAHNWCKIVNILLRKYAVISTCDFSVFLVYFCGVVVLKRFSEYPGTLWAESIPHLERPVIRLSPQISLQQRSKTPLMSLSRNSHPNLSHIRNILVGLTLKIDMTVILISHSPYLRQIVYYITLFEQFQHWPHPKIAM